MRKPLVAIVVVRAHVRDRVLVELLEQLQRYADEQTSKNVEVVITLPPTITQRLKRMILCST